MSPPKLLGSSAREYALPLAPTVNSLHSHTQSGRPILPPPTKLKVTWSTHPPGPQQTPLPAHPAPDSSPDTPPAAPAPSPPSPPVPASNSHPAATVQTHTTPHPSTHLLIAQRQRSPELLPIRTQIKPFRHHSNHCVRLSIQMDLPSNDSSVPRKPLPPQPVTQHHQMLSRSNILPTRKRSPKQRIDAKHRKEIRRHRPARNLHRTISLSQRKRTPLQSRQPLKRPRIASPAIKISRRHLIVMPYSLVDQTVTIRSGFGNGNGRNTTAYTMLNTAATAPTPIPSVTTASSVLSQR